MLEMTCWQWGFAFFGAFLIGLSKTGIAGLGILFVAIFANIIPAKQSVGLVLPLLICGDIFAVAAYRRHAEWKHLWRLFPWAAIGVVAGFMAMGRLQDQGVTLMIGVILLVLAAVHLWRKRQIRLSGVAEAPFTGLFPALVCGILAGFTTMVSNAAGPIMVLYLLAMGLPKYVFLGTAAWYFLIMNLFKVPFAWHLDIIDSASLLTNLVLIPAVMVGALTGRRIITYIPQNYFEGIALTLTLAAGLRLFIVGLP